MSLRNIHSDIKEIIKEAIAKKDYQKVMAILNKLFSPSLSQNNEIDGIFFKDVKQIVKTKEDLENILLSTKVVFENKEVSEYIQKHFIVLSLDVQKDTLPDGFNFPGIPAFFFLDENAKEKNKITGGDKADKFLKSLKALK